MFRGAVECRDREEWDARSQLPTSGISSPKATITESGIAKGTPITINETYVAPRRSPSRLPSREVPADPQPGPVENEAGATPMLRYVNDRTNSRIRSRFVRRSSETKNTASRSMKTEKTSPEARPPDRPHGRGSRPRAATAAPRKAAAQESRPEARRTPHGSLVAVRVLRRAIGELDHLAEKRRHDDPADADDDREGRDVDHHRGQPERQAKAPVKPLARPRQRRGEEDAEEQDEQDVADHEQADDHDDGQDGEQQPQINRQRPMDQRLTGSARRCHLDRIPVKRPC